MREGKIIWVKREFWSDRKAVILRILSGKKILKSLAKKFFEFVVEFLWLLGEGPLDRIFLSQKREVFKRVPELSDAIFSIFVFDKVIDGVPKVIIGRAGQRIARVEMARFSELWDAVVEDSVPDNKRRPRRPGFCIIFSKPLHDPPLRLVDRIEDSTRIPP